MAVAIAAGGSLFGFGQACWKCAAAEVEAVEQAETPSCHAPVEVAVATCHASMAENGTAVITSCLCGDHNQAVAGLEAAAAPARTTVEPVASIQESYLPARLTDAGGDAADAAHHSGDPPGAGSHPIYLRDSVIRI